MGFRQVLRDARIVAAGAALASLAPALARSQAFDCVELNDLNTNLFVPPDSCFADPEGHEWCDCARSVFTRPLRGQKTGLQQAVLWILSEPGIGNHRVEVGAGTLDLSGLRVGDILGSALVDELIPGSFPLVGGELFTVRIELRVTAVAPDRADFDAVIVEASHGAQTALFYDPTDETHSFGHLYTGRLASRGPGKGFVLEYRYAKERIQASPERHAAVQVNEAGSPTFTIPILFRFFSAESGVYTLPDAPSATVTTTLRRFTDDTLSEILDLGDDDLCRVLDDPRPCKVAEERLDLHAAEPANAAPEAVIVPLDGFTLTLLPEDQALQTFCGRARVLLRGRNSHDGDGGRQPLAYEWLVRKGPPAGAEIPELTRRFKDTQVFLSKPGNYEIGLRVADGGPEPNADEAVVAIAVLSDFDENVPPTAAIETRPSPAVVDLAGGVATVTLDGSASSNGAPGDDDCGQKLAFRWREVLAPPGAASRIVSPSEAVTAVEMTAPGTYTFELLVDDGAAVDSTDTEQVDVTVRGEAAPPRLVRGDSDADGRVNLTDAVRTLNWLFRGDPSPPCLDAADSDDSGGVNITDPIHTLQFLFLGGAAPPAPGPFECGEDPTGDGLAACEHAAC
ncbi:MAG: hypothetical protein HY721_24220 [Planctomycetes bacterium]|nr:hypothetical protein [Planctomycetota bacterium]